MPLNLSIFSRPDLQTKKPTTLKVGNLVIPQAKQSKQIDLSQYGRTDLMSKPVVKKEVTYFDFKKASEQVVQQKKDSIKSFKFKSPLSRLFNYDIFGESQIATEKAERDEELKKQGATKLERKIVSTFPTTSQITQGVIGASQPLRAVTATQASKLAAQANRLAWKDISDITAGRIKSGPKFEAYKVIAQDKALLQKALAKKGKQSFAQTFKEAVDDVVGQTKAFADDFKVKFGREPKPAEIKLLEGTSKQTDVVANALKAREARLVSDGFIAPVKNFPTTKQVGNLNIPVQPALTPDQSLIQEDRKAETFADKLGIKLEPEKQAKGTVEFKLSGDNKTINFPEGFDLSSKKGQQSLFHEIGHYVDDVTTSGGIMKTNVDATSFKSKFSLPNKQLLFENKDYILDKVEDTIHNIDFTFKDKNGKAIKFNSIEDLKSNTEIPLDVKNKFLKSFDKAVEKYKRYHNQPPELFANGFREYIVNGEQMKTEAPELYNLYDNIFKTDTKLQSIYSQANKPAQVKAKTKSGKQQLAEREQAKLDRQLAREKKSVLEFSDELENQYQDFKKLPNKNVEDEVQLKAKNPQAKQDEIDNILYSQEMNSDDVLQLFQDRLTKEREPLPTVPKETKAIVAEKAKQQIRTAKEVLDRRRSFIKAVQKQFGLSDNDLKSITQRDIRLMSTFEFKQFLDDIRIKAEKLAEKNQAKNELLSQIQEKNLDIEPLRQAMKLPKIANMTTTQLREMDKTLQPYMKDDVFLSKRKLETIDRTELEGIKTYREATEILSKKLGIKKEDLGNIKVSEFDRFRGDTSLAERNPFYKMMVEETAKLQFIRDAEYLEMEEKLFSLANKLGIKKRFELVPRQKKIAEWFDAKDKSKVELTPEETDLVKFMQDEWIKARDYLIKIEAMKKGVNTDNYFTHIRRNVLEAVVEDGPIRAVKEVFESYKLDELKFNILDDRTGEVMALDKFFRFAMRRSGKLVPTKNIVGAFQAYMKTFKRKQALDEIVPLIDIYAHSLTPKGKTKTGVLLDSSLIRFTKEWLNTKKGRKVSLSGVLKQGGRVDLTLRGMKAFTTLMDLGANLPVTVATQVGEQAVTYQLLGKGKYVLAKARAITPKGKRITNKYRNFVGKDPWGELIEPAKSVGNRLSEGLFVLFQDANVRRTRNFLLGSLTNSEWQTETITSKRLAELRTEMGRYGVIPGASSVIGATSGGKVFTQYKTWALPILRSELNNVAQLKKLFTKDKAPGKRALLDLYRTMELVAIVMIIRGMMGEDDDDDSMIGKIKARAYQEMSTIWQALDPKLYLSPARLASFLNDLGQNLSSILKLEQYEASKFGAYEIGDLKGVKAFKQQFTPRAIKQFQKDKVKTLDDVKKEIKEGIESGKLSVDAAKIKLADEIKKIEKNLKTARFEMDEDEYKKDLAERIKAGSITASEAKTEAREYVEQNKEEIKQSMSGVEEDDFIAATKMWAKALSVDPITAFTFFFSGEKIRRIDNGTIIVHRGKTRDGIEQKEFSIKKRKEFGATDGLILDHTVPIELGYGNPDSNLKLVPEEDWKDYTLIENFLGDKLRAGLIDGDEAQKLIKGYKNGTITEEDLGKL